MPAFAALLGLAAGYAMLMAGSDAIAPVILVAAYLGLLPWAIMRAGRPTVAPAKSGGRRQSP